MTYLIDGKSCYLRSIKEEDAFQLALLVGKNREYWSVFEPEQEPIFYTVEGQKTRIKEIAINEKQGKEFSFGIFAPKSSEIIGFITLYEFRRYPFKSALIGYSIDESWTKRGIATEAVKLLTKFGLKKLNIHRIEAYVSPKNIGSMKVLGNVGYTQEGLLRELLHIRDKWEDHYLYSFLDSEVI